MINSNRFIEDMEIIKETISKAFGKDSCDLLEVQLRGAVLYRIAYYVEWKDEYVIHTCNLDFKELTSGVYLDARKHTMHEVLQILRLDGIEEKY